MTALFGLLGCAISDTPEHYKIRRQLPAYRKPTATETNDIFDLKFPNDVEVEIMEIPETP